MISLIHYYIFIGDSLSDPGFMSQRKLLGLIPMDKVAGLRYYSPKGSFTNGYVWDKNFGFKIAEEAIINKLKQQGKQATDIADGIISHDPQVTLPLKTDFQLEGYQKFRFKNQDLVRFYAEGGLTSYDYSKRITAHPSLLFTQKILSTLEEKRFLLLKDDEARCVDSEHKKKTLITEWSGANDLITVNLEPTEKAAYYAVQTRLHNIEELIQAGYMHFILFNLPDLSLTPRLQSQSKEKQAHIQSICLYFNNLLTDGVIKLGMKYPHCFIGIFDAYTIFNKVYQHPEHYHLDSAKKKTPYITSSDFILEENQTSHAPGYLFWDDIHPSAHVHELLSEKFYIKIRKLFEFSIPEESLLQQFREAYGQRYANDLEKCGGFFRKSHLNYKSKQLDLHTILRHALHEKGQRTREIILELGWINQDNKLISQNPSLVLAMQQLQKDVHHSRYTI